jgi:transposase
VSHNVLWGRIGVNYRWFYKNQQKELFFMIFLGIDIASKKHDCCIIGEKGDVLAPIFNIKNDCEGYDILLKAIRSLCRDFTKVRVGLESTGHYGDNLISFLRAKGFEPIIFNPLQVDLYRKAGTLRKTKTDKADARFIAQMLSTTESSPLLPIKPEIVELKALVRHRGRLKTMRSRLRVSVSRLVTVLFPELSTAIWSIHQSSSYAMLLVLPTAAAIADCHLTKLSNLLGEASRGKYGKDRALEIKALASKSVGSNSSAIRVTGL